MSTPFSQLDYKDALVSAEQVKTDPFLLCLMDIIRQGLVTDGHVRLHQFGTFRLKWSKPGTRRMPDGSTRHIPSQPRVYFTPAKHLRELIEPHPAAMRELQNNVVNITVSRAMPRPSVKETPLTPPVSGPKPSLAEKNSKKRFLIPASLALTIPLIIGLLNTQLSNELVPPETRPTQSLSQVVPTAQPTQQVRTEVQPPLAKVKIFLSPQVHVIQAGDNLWKLAQSILGDAHLWPYLYRANQRTLSNPDQLQVGQKLVIPGLRQPASNLHSEDSRQVAEGYLMLYQYYKQRGDQRADNYLLAARRYDRAIKAS